VLPSAESAAMLFWALIAPYPDPQVPPSTTVGAACSAPSSLGSVAALPYQVCRVEQVFVRAAERFSGSEI
jgi:hypothetical protein